MGSLCIRVLSCSTCRLHSRSPSAFNQQLGGPNGSAIRHCAMSCTNVNVSAPQHSSYLFLWLRGHTRQASEFVRRISCVKRVSNCIFLCRSTAGDFFPGHHTEVGRGVCATGHNTCGMRPSHAQSQILDNMIQDSAGTAVDTIGFLATLFRLGQCRFLARTPIP